MFYLAEILVDQLVSSGQLDAPDIDYSERMNDAVAPQLWEFAVSETVHIPGCTCAVCAMRSVCTSLQTPVFQLTFRPRRLTMSWNPYAPFHKPTPRVMLAVRCLHFAPSWKFYIHLRIWVPLPPFLIPRRTPGPIPLLTLLERLTQKFPR